ncbi:MAG TPA: heparan-alpha-glucosaminide N-acetyltransferase domain-containing protein [Bryobacteraceae bacterium]|nr:heparan-alpha-glucosaminide N-acetyltransferase domain-containing protein [Bryobacteraceae bacterium]
MPKTAAQHRAAPAQPQVSPPAHSERLISLDAFRGLTMALMVLVNNAGSGAIYYQFKHAEWNGWTIADTIFPSFIWIVGVAITIALGKRVASGVPKSRLLTQATRRACILFVFGLIVYLAPAFDLSTQRILGVLQRIAICYLIAVALYLSTGVRGQILWTLGLLAAYWMLMTLVPVPGYGPGNLSVEGNFAHYIDRIVLGAHNYHSTQTWDPEGVVSTLPAIATGLLGLLAGRLLTLQRSLAERCVWLFITGSGLLFAALVCDIWMPINKHLWTSSFSLFMAGLDFLVFAGFLWLVDGCGYRKYVKPFTIMGMNAIAVYMVSELFAEVLEEVQAGGDSLQSWIYQHLFASIASPPTAAMLYAVAFTLLMYALAYALYRKKWFLRV